MNTDAALVLRGRLAGRNLLVAPGICDVFTARLVQGLDFEALYLGGNAIGLALGMGQPFVTLTDTVELASRICRDVDLPVIVDAGAGFGDAAHTYRAVRNLAFAGVAALHIDDQIYPKRAHYHRGKVRLTTSDVMGGKLAAAREAREGDGPMIFARTDALRATGSIEAVIERGERYAAAGAEALVVLDLLPAQAAAVRAALPDLPLIYLGGIHEPVPSVEELAEEGFAAALYPFNTMAGIVAGVTATWKPLRTTGRPGKPFDGDTKDAVRQALQWIDMPRYWEIESRTTEAPDANAGS